MPEASQTEKLSSMIHKNSIKFKLIFVISVITLLLMCVLFFLQLYNSFRLESAIERSSLSTLQDYIEQEHTAMVDKFEEDIEHYLQMMALTVAHELYNLNLLSLQDKTDKLVQHQAVCSIAVIDNLTHEAIASARRQGVSGCMPRTLEIVYNDESIGRLEVEYTLAPIQQLIGEKRRQLHETREHLHEDIASATRESIIVQTLIYLLVTLILVRLTARQINRNIINPIYALMDDMQRMHSQDPVALQLRNRPHSNDELGKLSRYFYDNIAELISQLNQRANYDSLTRLLSRQRLIYDIEHAASFNLAILDIDRFKEVNNFLGMNAGDDFLRSTATLLRQFFAHQPYAIYRLNGDEFAIFDSRGDALEAFEMHILAFVERFGNKEQTVKGETITASISAGIASSRHPSPIVAATTALKYAKLKHTKIATFQEDLPILKEYQQNLKTTRIIRKAITQDWITPHFQPIQDVRTGRVCKYEALMRISDAEGTLYTPAEFLAVSKRSGNYKELSASMLRKSVACFSATELALSINLAIEDIEESDILDTLETLQRQHGVMDRLIFEITEQEGFSSPERIKAFIDQVKRLGARVAIDDFGSGYSNFETLIHLDIDFLKIDGSLIKNILTDPHAEVIVETIVDFARRLGIKTIAEFVSDEAIYRKIASLGIDFAQGYYIGKPAPLISHKVRSADL
ncbi:bifunctional diguanylate cyclase/phosphodiesterase [Marichromatium sp. AB31]|nr:bifunctional diguanylate cyclase/phosphodiesterase [Marichromatium sp. AB31]